MSAPTDNRRVKTASGTHWPVASGSALFLKLREWIWREWGVTLERCGGERSIARYVGAWKTGWMLSGSLPGYSHTCRRFDTLKQVARHTGYEPNR